MILKNMCYNVLMDNDRFNNANPNSNLNTSAGAAQPGMGVGASPATPTPSTPPAPGAPTPPPAGPAVPPPAGPATPPAPGMPTPPAPGAPAPGAPAPAPANPAAGKKKMNKPLVIGLSCAAVAVVVVGIVVAVVMMNMNNKPKAENNPPVATQPAEPSKIDLNSATKEDVIEAITQMAEEGYAPEGLFDDEVVEIGTGTYPTYMGYYINESYEDQDEVDNETFGQSDSDDLEITPVGDYYVMAVKLAESPMSGGMTMFSFDENYVNYEFETVDTDTGFDSVETITFNDVTEDFLQEAMPVVALATNTASLQINTIYDHEFEMDDDVATLTLYQIIPQFDTSTNYAEMTEEELEDVSGFALMINKFVCQVDLETGEFSWVDNDDDGNTFETIETFPLNKDEYTEVMTALMGDDFDDSFNPITGTNTNSDSDNGSDSSSSNSGSSSSNSGSSSSSSKSSSSSSKSTSNR